MRTQPSTAHLHFLNYLCFVLFQVIKVFRKYWRIRFCRKPSYFRTKVRRTLV
ncbi:unnamed protein product [Anisakis simplex]|uniref:Uncharacterized protein n=1 Tax=Anisakis simplex TaxID=6269 RepID=A0A3P6NZ33_ANISI|nr:unnamed protein product [Anisakis simplex]